MARRQLRQLHVDGDAACRRTGSGGLSDLGQALAQQQRRGGGAPPRPPLPGVHAARALLLSLARAEGAAERAAQRAAPSEGATRPTGGGTGRTHTHTHTRARARAWPWHAYAWPWHAHAWACWSATDEHALNRGGEADRLGVGRAGRALEAAHRLGVLLREVAGQLAASGRALGAPGWGQRQAQGQG